MEQIMSGIQIFDPQHMAFIVGSFAFIVFDIVVGVAQAVKTGTLSSTKMREGLWHKCGFILGIAFAILVEMGLGACQIDVTVPLCAAVCAYIILTEVVSIAENLCVLSPELARLLNRFIDEAKGKLDESYGTEKKGE